MAKVDDVAAYILQKQGPMSTWKLQKLVYYCQAWHLVWADDELFSEPIEAWANGPVIPRLYDGHHKQFKVGVWRRGDASRLTSIERKTIDAVLKFYGKRTGHWLSELTHQERPWRDARQGLLPSERGHCKIAVNALAEYYGSL